MLAVRSPLAGRDTEGPFHELMFLTQPRTKSCWIATTQKAPNFKEEWEGGTMQNGVRTRHHRNCSVTARTDCTSAFGLLLHAYWRGGGGRLGPG